MLLKTELLAHQKRAFEKLKDIKVSALFMDMGTGKSRTVLEFIRYRKEKGTLSSVLWFCPVSVRQTIREEVRKHSSFSCHVFDEDTGEGVLPMADIYVCGIQSVVSPRVFFACMNLVDANSYVVCDESIFIKTHNTLRTERITLIAKAARYRTILNGTPISCHEGDLFSQFFFLSPLILGFTSFYSFAKNHLVYSEKYPGMVTKVLDKERLAGKIAPYVYQVKKEECFDLPEKVYQKRWFSLTAKQKQDYQFVKEDLFSRFEEDNPDDFLLFRLFNHLQHITCGQMKYLRQYFYFQDISSKEQALLDELEMLAEKVMVVAKYTFELDRLCTLIKDRPVFRYYGDIRDDLSKFLKSENGVLLANAKCIGYGLNLQECSTLFYYSNTFMYSERLQVEDRVYRYGQKKQVRILDFVGEGTIDEYIAENLWKKKNIAEALQEEVQKVKDKKYLNKIVGGVWDAEEVH